MACMRCGGFHPGTDCYAAAEMERGRRGGNDPCNPRNSSVGLPGGGDTHFHPFGLKETDFLVTTRLRGGVEIHDKVKP